MPEEKTVEKEYEKFKNEFIDYMKNIVTKG